MRRLSELAGGRREFFRAAARGGLLGLLGVVALVTGGRPGARDQRCVNRGICSGCGVFDTCALPQALSAKQARPGPERSELSKRPAVKRTFNTTKPNEARTSGIG